MGCNFNCPYCFEDHFAGKMSPEVQDDVVGLAQRMAKASGAQSMSVTWFGGEPLLAPNIIDALSQRLMTVAKEYGMEYSASIITTGFLLDQDIVDMLERCKVSNAQITIDGLGPTHDITRKLANGDPTFERITTNLRELHIPFRVNVRHNVHEANKSEMDELRAFIEGLAEESGNRLRYYPAPVLGSRVADERGEQVDLLCGTAESEVGVIQEANRFYAGRGNYCGAHSIWSVGIDEKGNLQKCWEAVDKPDISFGTAAAWDPTDALFSATKPDNLSMYLNTAVPVPDEECRQCVWLPHCVGGCPHKRIFEECKCVPYKDDPASYVLALHARIGEDKKDTDQNKNHTKG
ncbi:MAG: radical SAM protein [Atopobiaceae bacterium]|nr:radical SAM protein [Atopobiaceae bacterium]